MSRFAYCVKPSLPLFCNKRRGFLLSRFYFHVYKSPGKRMTMTRDTRENDKTLPHIFSESSSQTNKQENRFRATLLWAHTGNTNNELLAVGINSNYNSSSHGWQAPQWARSVWRGRALDLQWKAAWATNDPPDRTTNEFLINEFDFKDLYPIRTESVVCYSSPLEQKQKQNNKKKIKEGRGLQKDGRL